MKKAEIIGTKEIALIKKEIAPILKDLSTYDSLLTKTKIVDQTDYLEMESIEATAKALKKQVQDKAKPIIDPLNAVIKHVRGEIKPTVDMCDKLVRHIKDLKNSFLLETRQKEQKKADRKAARLEKKGSVEEAELVRTVTESIKPSIVTTQTVREVWRIDASLETLVKAVAAGKLPVSVVREVQGELNKVALNCAKQGFKDNDEIADGVVLKKMFQS